MVFVNGQKIKRGKKNNSVDIQKFNDILNEKKEKQK